MEYVYVVTHCYESREDEDERIGIFRDPHDAVKCVIDQVTNDIESVTNLLLHDGQFPYYNHGGAYYIVEKVKLQ